MRPLGAVASASPIVCCCDTVTPFRRVHTFRQLTRRINAGNGPFQECSHKHQEHGARPGRAGADSPRTPIWTRDSCPAGASVANHLQDRRLETVQQIHQPRADAFGGHRVLHEVVGTPGTRRRGQAAGGWRPTGQAVAASSGPISRLRLGSGLGAIDMTWTGPAPGRRRQTQARGAARQGGDDGGPSAAPRMRRNTVAGQHAIFPKKTRGTDDADHRSPSPASCEQRSRSRKTSSFHLVRSPGLHAARRTVEA